MQLNQASIDMIALAQGPRANSAPKELLKQRPWTQSFK